MNYNEKKFIDKLAEIKEKKKFVVIIKLFRKEKKKNDNEDSRSFSPNFKKLVFLISSVNL